MNALNKFIKTHSYGQLYVFTYNLKIIDFFSFKLFFRKH